MMCPKCKGSRVANRNPDSLWCKLCGHSWSAPDDGDGVSHVDLDDVLDAISVGIADSFK